MAERSTKAITSFVEGLGKMQKNGDDVNGMLDALGIKGIRELIRFYVWRVLVN